MKTLFRVAFFSVVLQFSVPAQVFGIGPCVNCGDSVMDEQVEEKQALQCPKGHRLDQECLTEQVRSHGLEGLKSHGLSCCGVTDEGDACEHQHSLSEIMNGLALSDREELQRRLDLADRPGDETREFGRLSDGILESFNLRCPTEGCGQVLERPTEGGTCNATQCTSCEEMGCYLCLKQLPTLEAAHAHITAHSGGCWEFRKGYMARYHWLLARKDLARLFKIKVTDEVRTAALRAQEVELKERKMWPMPAGLRTEDWLDEVHDSEVSDSEKIELLQNEFIYLRLLKLKARAELVAEKIHKLGGRVLITLDKKDEKGVHFRLGDARNLERLGLVERPGEELLPVHSRQGFLFTCGKVFCTGTLFGFLSGFLDQEFSHMKQNWAPRFANITVEDPRYSSVTGRLREFGNVYEVDTRIWSSAPLEKMNYTEGYIFCFKLGGHLPDHAEFSTLRQALGFQAPGSAGVRSVYNPSLFSGLRDHQFWVGREFLTPLTESHVFHGSSGHLFLDQAQALHSVRCAFSKP